MSGTPESPSGKFLGFAYSLGEVLGFARFARRGRPFFVLHRLESRLVGLFLRLGSSVFLATRRRNTSRHRLARVLAVAGLPHFLISSLGLFQFM